MSALGESVAGRLDEMPAKLAELGELARDNPGPMAVLAAASIITQKILINAVRPRGILEWAAVLVAGPALAAVVADQAMRRGLVRFRVRDHHGCLVPLEFGGPGRCEKSTAFMMHDPQRGELHFCGQKGCQGQMPGSSHDDCADSPA